MYHSCTLTSVMCEYLFDVSCDYHFIKHQKCLVTDLRMWEFELAHVNTFYKLYGDLVG